MNKFSRIWMIFFVYPTIKVDEIKKILTELIFYHSGDDVNVRAVVSNLQEKTRLHSKSRHLLPTRMMKKTKQIKHVRVFSLHHQIIKLDPSFYFSYSKIVIFVVFNFVF